ncbi:amidohydrolase, partial [Pseudomonas sp. FSL R10-0765]|uniref:amidohydrolase n=1 Tax=Pseudomonas sp. FSL R10-0765 TaxID=2662195 RepID=UPI001C49A1A2
LLGLGFTLGLAIASVLLSLVIGVLGAEQLVFGSDYAPVPDIAPGIAQVLAAPISAAERELILRGNGQRLLASKGISLGS